MDPGGVEAEGGQPSCSGHGADAPSAVLRWAVNTSRWRPSDAEFKLLLAACGGEAEQRQRIATEAGRTWDELATIALVSLLIVTV